MVLIWLPTVVVWINKYLICLLKMVGRNETNRQAELLFLYVWSYWSNLRHVIPSATSTQLFIRLLMFYCIVPSKSLHLSNIHLYPDIKAFIVIHYFQLCSTILRWPNQPRILCNINHFLSLNLCLATVINYEFSYHFF